MGGKRRSRKAKAYQEVIPHGSVFWIFISPDLPDRGPLCPWSLTTLGGLLNPFQVIQAPGPTLMVEHSDASYGCEEAKEGEDQCEHDRHWRSAESVVSHCDGKGGRRRACAGRGTTLQERVWAVGVRPAGGYVVR